MGCSGCIIAQVGPNLRGPSQQSYGSFLSVLLLVSLVIMLNFVVVVDGKRYISFKTSGYKTSGYKYYPSSNTYSYSGGGDDECGAGCMVFVVLIVIATGICFLYGVWLCITKCWKCCCRSTSTTFINDTQEMQEDYTSQDDASTESTPPLDELPAAGRAAPQSEICLPKYSVVPQQKGKVKGPESDGASDLSGSTATTFINDTQEMQEDKTSQDDASTESTPPLDELPAAGRAAPKSEICLPKYSVVPQQEGKVKGPESDGASDLSGQGFTTWSPRKVSASFGPGGCSSTIALQAAPLGSAT